jgi:hypothetical protein
MGPFRAVTKHYLSTPFHYVVDDRHPYSIGNQQTYYDRQAAEDEAKRLNRLYVNRLRAQRKAAEGAV